MPRDKQRARFLGTKSLSFAKEIRSANISVSDDSTISKEPGYLVELAQDVTKGQAGYAIDGVAYLADRTSLSTIAEFIFLEDGTADNICLVSDYGIVETAGTYSDGFLYLGTAGNLTQTIPSSNIQPVGKAISEIQLKIDIGKMYI